MENLKNEYRAIDSETMDNLFQIDNFEFEKVVPIFKKNREKYQNLKNGNTNEDKEKLEELVQKCKAYNDEICNIFGLKNNNYEETNSHCMAA